MKILSLDNSIWDSPISWVVGGIVLLGVFILLSVLVELMQPTAADISKKHEAQCLGWGATKGSPEYIQCRAILAAQTARQKQSDDHAAANLGVGMALGAAMGAGRR
jgi:hypothetical protein